MGYQRKVKEEVTITCDRCGRRIPNNPDYLCHITCFKLLKWCLPTGHVYKSTYLCKRCWDGLVEYLDVANNETGGDT